MLPAWLAARFMELLHRAATDVETRLVKNREQFEYQESIIECLEDQLAAERAKRAKIVQEQRELEAEESRLWDEIEKVKALYPAQ